jgi:hypothetical protein
MKKHVTSKLHLDARSLRVLSRQQLAVVAGATGILCQLGASWFIPCVK